MIRIIKGTYGLRRGNKIEAMTPGTEPFSLSPEREKELVNQGTAEYVAEPEKAAQVNTDIPDEPEQHPEEKPLDNKNDRKKRK